jgi:hypothetical protein
VPTFSPEESKGFNAVLHPMKAMGDSCIVESLPGETHIPRVIFHEKNLNGSSRAHATSLEASLWIA